MPPSGGRSEEKGSRRPLTCWVSPTVMGPTIRRATSQSYGRRSAKRMAAKLKEIRAQLRMRMHGRIAGTVQWLQQVVRGYFQYHAIPGNWARKKAFRNDVLCSWLQSLRRRSQRSRLTGTAFRERLGALLPPVQILQPYPDVRFDARHPNIRGKNRVRQERQHGSVRGAAGNRC